MWGTAPQSYNTNIINLTCFKRVTEFVIPPLYFEKIKKT